MQFNCVLVVLLATFIQFTSSSSPSKSSAKVHVLVCIEALCIDSKHFVTETLAPDYRSLRDVIDLSVIPFGKAVMKKIKHLPVSEFATKSPDGEYYLSCQHGDAECDANTWEQCVIQIYPDPKDYLPVLNCAFKTIPMGYSDYLYSAAFFEKCAMQNESLNFDLIQACHDDSRIAWDLQIRADESTPLELNHVPWIEINGVRFDVGKEIFSVAVCEEFTRNGGESSECDRILYNAKSLTES